MLLQIEHDLRFHYDDWVRESFLELRMEPITTPHQGVRSFHLAVGPPTGVERYLDWNGNFVHHFGITDYHDRIEVRARALVETRPPGARLEAATERPDRRARLGPLLDFVTLGGPVQRSERLEALASELAVPPDAPLGEQVHSIGRLVRERLEYRPGVTHFASTTDHVLEQAAGVCQDFAHVALGLLRLRGIPSRYVSGYLHDEGRDAPSQSHAWIQVCSQASDWLGFDPTHDREPDERYVEVATGRHYDDVPPNRGLYRGGARESLEAAVRSSRASHEDNAALQQRIPRIEVPVFREVPLGSGSAAPVTEEQAAAAGQQ